MIPNIIKQFEQQNNMHNQQVQTMQAQNKTTPPVHYRRPTELIDTNHRMSSTININSKSSSESNNKNQQPVPLNNEKHRLQMLLVDIIEKKSDLIKQLQEIEKQVHDHIGPKTCHGSVGFFSNQIKFDWQKGSVFEDPVESE
jgi:hypothetical protein